MDILDKKIGAEGAVKVIFSGGKISLTGSEETKGVGIELTVSVDADYFLDQLALALPGTLDDAIIAVVKSAIHNL